MSHLVVAVVAAVIVAASQSPAVADALKFVQIISSRSEPVFVQSTGPLELSAGASVGIDPRRNEVTLSSSHDRPLFVRPVVDGGQTPFQVQLDASIAEGSNRALASFQVPATGDLVIEFLSFRWTPFPLGPGFEHLLIETTTRGTTVIHAIAHAPAAGNQAFYSVDRSLRLYADAGSDVQITGEWATTLTGVSGFPVPVITVSGVLR